MLRDSSAELPRLVGVMAREADGKGYVAEQLCALVGPELIQLVGTAARNMSQQSPEASSFLLHICKNLIDRDSTIITNAERSSVFFDAISCRSVNHRRELRGWLFLGILDRLDFKDVSFSQCRFVDVTFRTEICSADESTHFIDCAFSGNIKTALRGTYHAVRPKYAQRYLAEFEYRFNRRFDLPDIIPRLVYVALAISKSPPLPVMVGQP